MLDRRSDEAVVVTSFPDAFRAVSVHFGRSNSNVVLFSGVPPENLVSPKIDDLRVVSEQIGLDVSECSLRALKSSDVDLPAIILFDDGGAVALLESAGTGSYWVGGSQPNMVHADALTELHPKALFSFSLVYLNEAENASVGLAQDIEKRHWLVSTLSQFWRTYIHVALAAFIINLIALCSPLFVMNVYDRVLPNKAISTLWILSAGIALATVFDLLLKTARSALIDYAARKADTRLSNMLFDKVLNATLESRPLSTGEYANRVTQYEFVREFFGSNTIGTLIDSAFLFIFLFVIYLIADWLVVIPFVAFIAAVVIGLVAQYRIGRRVATAANESSRRQALLVETIASIETVKSLRAESHMLRRWQELTKQSTRTSEEIKLISSGASNSTQFVQQLVSVFIIIAGTYSFSEGQISMGAIIAANMLAGRAVAPLGQISMTLARMKQAFVSLRILDGIMQQPEDRPQTAGFVNRQIKRGSLSFKSVAFSYPATDVKVIQNLSFSVEPGERVGIIGRIGSGKTTVGRLLGGLYKPAEGSVYLDGVDIRQYHPSEVRSAVAVAGQTADLFSGTVKENLLIVRPDATDDELLDVCRSTGVDAFVAQHPRGFDMPVGERGNNLSGGQRQALTIARLLLMRPKIVYLDEPSGAMDLATERQLIAKLRHAFTAQTTVIISTHRYSMLDLVDRLIVLDQGRVVADGPKASVIEALQRGSAASAENTGALR